MAVDLRLGSWQSTLDAGPSRVADASVRLLLTSPPYDNARTYEGTQTEPVDFGELARFALRVLMPGGTLAMVLDGAVNDGEQSVTPYRVICEWAAMKGWRLLQVLAYGRKGAPGLYGGRFRKDHEPLIVFVKDGGDPVCEKERVIERAVHTNSDPRVRKRDGTVNPRTSLNDESLARKHRGSIWWYGANGHGIDASVDTGHPATFAERFALDAVQVWSNPGDLVLDPYAGSATVGRACIDLGRSFVGAERVPKYHAIGVERMRQTSIFDRIAPREEATAAE
jgi:hypothetical protein